MKAQLITLHDAVSKAVEKHGGIRATERATGVDKGFIHRLLSGKKTSPSNETLRKLGLEAVPLYRVIAIDAALSQEKADD